MADQKYCQNCGASNLPNAVYCANCGNAFVSAAASPQPRTIFGLSRKMLVIGIVAVLLLLTLVAGWTINSTPSTSDEPWTELYLLGPGGEARNYPTNFTVGQTGTVTVGVINHENVNTNYTLVVILANKTLNSTRFYLPKGQTWQSFISFTPTQRGINQKLDFNLYMGGHPERGIYPSEVYRNVYYYISVT